ncbi:MAG: DUF2807 domain-containing protein, partial [Ignavibacteriales bacterium]|nr:DUF2807 domain-containing protein [Ignavibacteriales bacterium]
MKKYLLLSILMMIVLLISCQHIRGSGKIITESRDVKHFTRVVLACPGTMTVTQGKEESLTIEGDDNIVPKIETFVDDGTLTVRFRQKHYGNNFHPSRPLRFTLSLIDLSEGTVAGSGEMVASNIRSDKLELTIDGSGTIDIDELTAHDLQAQINGSGTFNMSGEVPQQKISINGSGDYNGRKLQTQSTRVSITGSGNSTVSASDHLDVTITGSGDVRYYGHPQVNERISG